MAIVSCTEEDLEGARTFRVALAEGTVARRTFRVISNSSSETETSVLTGARSSAPHALPAELELFPGSSVSLCYQFDVTRLKDDTLTWWVTCEYKSVFNQQEIDRSSHSDPTARPTRITGQSRTIMVPKRFMLRTDAYSSWNPSLAFKMVTAANSASDPLDPPVEEPQVEWELHCEKNVANLPSWFAATSGYANGVNLYDQPVTIRGQTIIMVAGTAALGLFNFSDAKQENGTDFITIGWNVTFRVPREKIGGEQAVPSPWDVERLDEGMRKRKDKQPSGGGPTIAVWDSVRDAKNLPVATPVPFNGNGVEIDVSGAAIPESYLHKFCYRPRGKRVDYSVIPWS